MLLGKPDEQTPKVTNVYQASIAFPVPVHLLLLLDHVELLLQVLLLIREPGTLLPVALVHLPWQHESVLGRRSSEGDGSPAAAAGRANRPRAVLLLFGPDLA